MHTPTQANLSWVVTTSGVKWFFFQNRRTKLARPYKNTSKIWPQYVNQYVSTVNDVILGHIPTKCMANAVYRRLIDDVFKMTSPEEWIRSSVLALYFGWNSSDFLLWSLHQNTKHTQKDDDKKNPSKRAVQGWLNSWNRAFALTKSEKRYLSADAKDEPPTSRTQRK